MSADKQPLENTGELLQKFNVPMSVNVIGLGFQKKLFIIRNLSIKTICSFLHFGFVGSKSIGAFVRICLLV